MRKILIKKTAYMCPENWNEITLRKQLEVSKLSDKYASEIDRKLAILSAYAGIPMDVLKSEKIDRMIELFNTISFISTDVPHQQLIEFDFNGKHYYTGQNLLEAEFQDFISIQNAIEAQSGDTYMALPLIIAVMAKQKKADGTFESISDYDVMKRSEEFMDLPIPIANGVAFFFASSMRLQENLTHLYSNPKQMVMKQIEEVENILKPVDGMAWHTRWLYGMLRSYIKSIKKDVNKSFTS